MKQEWGGWMKAGKSMRLELIDIHKRFGNKIVLKGISFTVESGKAMGLLGMNGAGKTTAIRILMNVFAPDFGTVRIDDRLIDYNRISFGYLPEERGLYPKKRIKEQLVYFASLKGMTRSDAVQAVDYWLQRLEVERDGTQRLETLSKGNQQKIQMIAALAHDPDIIIFDEPFSGLDPVNAALLKDIVKEKIWDGKIVLFSSHQMNYVEEFCDDIAIISDGKISLSGSLYQIKRSFPRDKLFIRSHNIDSLKKQYGDRCEVLGNHEVILSFLPGRDKNEMMKYLIGQYDIDEIRVHEPALNDIFIKYTGETL